MAEIQPSDIGLATFADVGDINNLNTDAKVIVSAINEILASGGNGSIIGTQLYVDGESNGVMGSDNVVVGNNNIVIGSKNIVLGNNHIVFGVNKYIVIMPQMNAEAVDIEQKRIYFWFDDEDSDADAENHEQPIVGDKIIISIYQDWSDTEWTDDIPRESEKIVTEITEVNLNESYFVVANLPEISREPPDDVYTELNYECIGSFIILSERHSIQGKNAVNMGTRADGRNAFSANYATVTADTAAALNIGKALANASFAANLSTANGNYSFAANQGEAYQNYSAAFNRAYSYNPYSFACGYDTKTIGRAIKCVEMDTVSKTLTVADGENLSGITGSKILIRAYRTNTPILIKEATVARVEDQTIYLNDITFNTGTYTEHLFNDGYVFVCDSSPLYCGYNSSGGYSSIAAGRYNHAFGYYSIAAHEGAVIVGKYGISSEQYSFSVANGVSLNAPGLAFKVLSDGSVHADGEYTSPCADYAEFFEWADGNPDNEDRAGYFVKLQGDKITKCNEFDAPLGVVSAMPAIIGDSGEMHWQGKFVTDDFGRVRYSDVVVPAETDDDGSVITEEHLETQPIINPDWNPKQKYIPRKDRPEWATVGVLGKLIVYDDGTLKQGDTCRCGNDGKAVKSISNGYFVLKRVSEDKVLLWLK